MNYKWYRYMESIREDYPEVIIDQLEAHMCEGGPETVVGDMFYRTSIHDLEIMIQILVGYAKLEEDDEPEDS